MKYTVHYMTRQIITVDIDGTPEELRAKALFLAKSHANRPDVEILQVLPEGVPSALGRDQPVEPRGPTRPTPPPPMPPLGSAGDLMLARAA